MDTDISTDNKTSELRTVIKNGMLLTCILLPVILGFIYLVIYRLSGFPVRWILIISILTPVLALGLVALTKLKLRHAVVVGGLTIGILGFPLLPGFDNACSAHFPGGSYFAKLFYALYNTCGVLLMLLLTLRSIFYLAICIPILKLITRGFERCLLHTFAICYG